MNNNLVSGFSTEPWNVNEQGINKAIIILLRLRKGANYDSKYTIPSSNSGIGQVLITVENSKSFSLAVQ